MWKQNIKRLHVCLILKTNLHYPDPTGTDKDRMMSLISAEWCTDITKLVFPLQTIAQVVGAPLKLIQAAEHSTGADNLIKMGRLWT